LYVSVGLKFAVISVCVLRCLLTEVVSLPRGGVCQPQWRVGRARIPGPHVTLPQVGTQGIS